MGFTHQCWHTGPRLHWIIIGGSEHVITYVGVPVSGIVDHAFFTFCAEPVKRVPCCCTLLCIEADLLGTISYDDVLPEWYYLMSAGFQVEQPAGLFLKGGE